jgi:hypothetical protein
VLGIKPRQDPAYQCTKNEEEDISPSEPPPLLTYRELVKEAGEKRHLSPDAVRKACSRCIEKTIDDELPQPIGRNRSSNLDGYMLAKRGEIAQGRKLPSAADCFYIREIS